MKTSIIGFKNKSADLHEKSSRIFIVSLIISGLLTAVLINISFTYRAKMNLKSERLPFVINMEKIPETRPASTATAPPKPFMDSGTPIEIDENIMPDEITIEEAPPDFDTALESQSQSTPSPGAESNAFDFEPVEEIPRKLNDIVPVYPAMAERAGVEGSVTLKVHVNTEGAVDSVEVVDGPKIFIESAIDAAKKTKFIPAKYNSKPVACWVLMPFRFMLED
ncbi:TonB family protein [Candidatus Latescibacterota bacterium]